MHPEWAMYLRVLLALHIACGAVGFVCAPVALATAKGGKVHRRWVRGKSMGRCAGDCHLDGVLQEEVFERKMKKE
jgi:hypothetical protein